MMHDHTLGDGEQEYNFGSMTPDLTNRRIYHSYNDATVALDAQVQELSNPPPESFSLSATLQLLDPLQTTTSTTSSSTTKKEENDDDDDDENKDENTSNNFMNNNNTDSNMVYLMTPSYLQNWLFWAFHQNVKKGESNRLVEALKLAAKRFGLTPPQDATAEELEDYVDPGPIDATFLSLSNNITTTVTKSDNDIENTSIHNNNNNTNNLYRTNVSSSHELLLNPDVMVKVGEFDGYQPQHQHQNLDSEFPELLRRVKSLPIADSGDNDNCNHNHDEEDENGNTNDDTSMVLHPCDSIDVEGDKIMCCAVPYRFYETLRNSLGVMCDDGFAVSFQPYPKETRSLIHHHIYQHNQDNGYSESDNVVPTSKEAITGGIVTNGNHHINDNNNNNNNNNNTNNQNGSNQNTYLSAVNNGGVGVVKPRARAPRRPIEFPRRIVMKSVGGGGKNSKYSTQLTNGIDGVASPMTKLLQEQERLAPPRIIPSVELYPIKLNYQIVDGGSGSCSRGSSSSRSSKQQSKHSGFVLVSRRTKVYDALHDLLKVTAPETSSSCKRVWSMQQFKSSCGSKSTKLGDGYEVIDTAKLDGKLKSLLKKPDTNKSSIHNKASQTVPKLLIGEWVRSHKLNMNGRYNVDDESNIDDDDNDDDDVGDELVRELDILVEIKRPSTSWPRENFELENRVQVGDFVDAQDIAGKWYEAIVQEVTDTTVNVHYFGWASRWNSTLLKNRNNKNIVEANRTSPRLQPIAPLYTHSGRWREGLKRGSVLEVRDSMSKADRPKWYKGIVKKVGGRHYEPSSLQLKSIEGGAQLELLHDIIGSSSTSTPTSSTNKNDDTITTTTTTTTTSDDVSNTENGHHQQHQHLSTAQSLILLNRNQQILVEVEKERENIVTNPADIVVSMRDVEINDTDSFLSEDPLKPQPPFLRWVNLYGEEICQAGTHLKIKSDGDLAVVTLRYEYEAGRTPVEILKSWNGMYGQGMVKEALRGTPPAPGAVGMHNLGNSCFLNSIIQCLNHIAPLTQYFLEDKKFSEDINRQNPLGSGGHVATAYAALLKEVWSGNYSALAPRLLKQTVASFAPQFRNSYQHDSQEFCQFLMDGLHEDCNRVTNKPYVEELEGFGMKDEKAAIETWRKHLLRHDSIIVDRCQGMHRSHLTCPSCGRESIKFDVFSTVSLPVVLEGKEGSNTNDVLMVEDCIEKFLEGEQLDEMNAWYCQGCKKHVCALKMIALWSVPDILILHLKRFQFEKCAVSDNILRSKVDNTVKFPVDNLDLTKNVLGPIDKDAPPVYNLFGVSEHVGVTANSGHYTATVRNCKDGRWYRYNDAHVGETTGETAVTGGAYLLFYQRAKGTAKWGGMEKCMLDRTIPINPYGGAEIDLDGFQTVVNKTKK
eukprot:CAMPEP_0170769684 /NCGR_PEP_ID=MMETSP0733-20121128/7105_1 /TAXON_ID=186038 /ORGANISM="Fragilariopsis kerguelensis, Strain L26-C5" /LENGTH=1382 /DNA_ID=CAMNT_0011111289 /DNA_START=85 /DNA_END=4230 /DNA_ORIENTATION=-